MMEITHSLSSHWSVFYLGEILVWVVLIYRISLWEVISLLHPCVFVGKCRLMSCKDCLLKWLQCWTGQNLRLFAHAITTSWMIFLLFMNSIEFLPLFFFLFSIASQNIWTHDALVFAIHGECKWNVYIVITVCHFLAALFVSTCRVLRRQPSDCLLWILELVIIASLSE